MLTINAKKGFTFISDVPTLHYFQPYAYLNGLFVKLYSNELKILSFQNKVMHCLDNTGYLQYQYNYIALADHVDHNQVVLNMHSDLESTHSGTK